MERDHKRLHKRIEDRVLAAPEVKQCYQVTGECDFVLIVSVPELKVFTGPAIAQTVHSSHTVHVDTRGNGSHFYLYKPRLLTLIFSG